MPCTWPRLSRSGHDDNGMKPPLGLQVFPGCELLTLLTSEILDAQTIHHEPPTWWRRLSILSEGSALGRIAKLSSDLAGSWLTQHKMHLAFTALAAADVVTFRIETGGCN